MPMTLLSQDTASLEDVQKKYMPIQNRIVYKMPGIRIHFHKLCLVTNW